MEIFKNTSRFGLMAMMATTLSVGFTACEDDEPEPEPTPTNTTPTPTVYSGNGALVAVQTVTVMDQPFVGEIEVDFGTAVAVFFNGTNYDSFVAAGTVKCEDEELTKQTTNQYYHQAGFTSQMGLEFSGAPDWEISGAGDVPAFNQSADRNFPNLGKITSSETITKSEGYTLTLDGGITNADSIIWIVGGVDMGMTGPMNSRTFTAQQLSSLQNGTSIAMVAAVNFQQVQHGGKMFWMINEKVQTKTVTVQ